jgi:hypothetical protein
VQQFKLQSATRNRRRNGRAELFERLGEFGTVVEESIEGVKETVRFKLPPELLEAAD